MRFPIGLKIFGIAVGLLVLMATVALMSMRMTRTVDGQLAIIDQNSAASCRFCSAAGTSNSTNVRLTRQKS